MIENTYDHTGLDGTTHVTYLHMKSNDHRRDKRRCFYYEKNHCLRFNEPCRGSAHCQQYEDLSQSARAEPNQEIKSPEEVTQKLKNAVFEQFSNLVKLNAKINDKESTELKTAIQSVRSAISAYNRQMAENRLTELQNMLPEEALKSYLKTQLVDGLRLTKIDGCFIVEPADNIGIEAYDVLAAIYPDRVDNIKYIVSIFEDNVIKVHFHNLDTPIKTGLADTLKYNAIRKCMGWKLTDIEKQGRGTLIRQLNELVRRVFRGIDVKMIRADLKWLELSFTRCDKNGDIHVISPKSAMDYLFRAVYTRVNGLQYEFR